MFKFNEEKLVFERVNLLKHYFLFLLVIAITLTITYYASERIIHVQLEKEVNIVLNNSFSKEELKNELKKYNFKYPDIIYAQAQLETGNFKSPVFKENNNLFGMREAKVRLTLNGGSNLNHAYYKDWKQSVVDRALYEAHYLHKLNRDQYFQYLGKLYAEDSLYVSTLKGMIKRNENQ